MSGRFVGDGRPRLSGRCDVCPRVGDRRRRDAGLGAGSRGSGARPCDSFQRRSGPLRLCSSSLRPIDELRGLPLSCAPSHSCELRESVIGRARANHGARMGDEVEPGWLGRLRPAARQRPRTQFVRGRWHDWQDLLRERDVLWEAAAEESRAVSRPFTPTMALQPIGSA